jgi:hypothetical protein
MCLNMNPAEQFVTISGYRVANLRMQFTTPIFIFLMVANTALGVSSFMLRHMTQATTEQSAPITLTFHAERTSTLHS